MQTEISKMSDNNLVEKFEEECIHQWSSGDKLIIREELLKRLYKNNIEEFKKSLIKEVNNTSFKIVNLEQDKIDDILKNTLINLIDNIGKE